MSDCKVWAFALGAERGALRRQANVGAFRCLAGFALRLHSPTLSAAVLLLAAQAAAQPIDVARLAAVGQVDPRYQSYNVEMVEVTGGRFWKPYRLGPPRDASDRYAFRPPLDLGNPRLRRLAAALGPAYVRVSGTWASSTYIAPQGVDKAPDGFNQRLTPDQWRGVADFVRAVKGQLVLSAPTSAGTRGPGGVWRPDQLEALLGLSRDMQVPVAGVAFMNEPNLVSGSGAPAGYTIADYARDYAAFATAMRSAAPHVRILGPGAVGGLDLETLAAAAGLKVLPMRALAAARPAVDVYTYHHYGAQSQRCATSGPLATRQSDGLDPAWLERTDATLNFHKKLRDESAPGAPIWVTETAQAACGGSPWAATFADTPRYVDQLGRLARGGVSAVFHNTLAASDYALLDERDFAPRPNYWAALIWARLMGATVLHAPSKLTAFRVYAHCLKGVPGGVALVGVNLGSAPVPLSFAGAGKAWSLADNGLSAVRVNGTVPKLGPKDWLPRLDGVAVVGEATVAPAGVTFVAIPQAGAAACV